MIQSALQFGGDSYPDGFWLWFNHNQHIYQEFEKRALQMARTHRKRYSARTIVEIIRWNTDLSDTDTTFQINDHYTPGMARIFMERHGRDFPKFFQIRDSRGFDECLKQ